MKRNIFRNTDGIIAIVGALALFPVLVVSGFMIDFAFRNYVDQTIQQAADVASVAGVGNLVYEGGNVTTATAEASKYFYANLNQLPKNISPRTVVPVIDVDLSQRKVTVTRGDYAVPTFFSGLVNIKSLPAAGLSEAQGASAGEVAFCKDSCGGDYPVSLGMMAGKEIYAPYMFDRGCSGTIIRRGSTSAHKRMNICSKAGGGPDGKTEYRMCAGICNGDYTQPIFGFQGTGDINKTRFYGPTEKGVYKGVYMSDCATPDMNRRGVDPDFYQHIFLCRHIQRENDILKMVYSDRCPAELPVSIGSVGGQFGYKSHLWGRQYNDGQTIGPMNFCSSTAQSANLRLCKNSCGSGTPYAIASIGTEEYGEPDRVNYSRFYDTGCTGTLAPPVVRTLARSHHCEFNPNAEGCQDYCASRYPGGLPTCSGGGSMPICNNKCAVNYCSSFNNNGGFPQMNNSSDITCPGYNPCLSYPGSSNPLCPYPSCFSAPNNTSNYCRWQLGNLRANCGANPADPVCAAVWSYEPEKINVLLCSSSQRLVDRCDFGPYNDNPGHSQEENLKKHLYSGNNYTLTRFPKSKVGFLGFLGFLGFPGFYAGTEVVSLCSAGKLPLHEMPITSTDGVYNCGGRWPRHLGSFDTWDQGTFDRQDFYFNALFNGLDPERVNGLEDRGGFGDKSDENWGTYTNLQHHDDDQSKVSLCGQGASNLGGIDGILLTK